MRRSALSWIAVLICACGGDDGGGEADCRFLVSGELTGTIEPCMDLTLLYNETGDEFTFTANNPDDPNLVVIASFTGPGMPMLQTYSSEDNADVRCGIGAQEQSTAWNASRTDTDVPRGECAITFTELQVEAEAGPIARYSATGVVDATLGAIETSGATGTVTLQIPFIIPPP